MPLNRFSTMLNLEGRGYALYRSSQPDADGLRTAGLLGVRFIYKLNREDESPVKEELAGGFQVESNPPNREMAPTQAWLRGSVAAVDRLLSTGPVLLHCTHGRERTGAVWAGKRVLDYGWTADQALAEFRLFGVNEVIWWFDRQIAECIRDLAAGK